MAKVQDAHFSSVDARMLAKVAITKKVGHFQRVYYLMRRMEQQIINDLKDTRIKRQGLTLSGGDPMHPRNVEALLPFVQRVKKNVQIRIFGYGRDINWMNLMIINVKCCLILTCLLMENLYKNRLTQAWFGVVQPIK